MAAAQAASGPPEPLPLFGGTAMERALEEAAASGTLILSGRRLRTFPTAAAQRWDLSDTTQADLSRNRLGEVPAATWQLPALEGLSLSHNCLRSVCPDIGHLGALAHLDISWNQLGALPPSLCQLPLRVLLAGGNRLTRLPENLGALSELRQLDVGCNRLRALPPGLGRLRALRDLNLRRNLLRELPEELSELPLVRLDFSCNRVSAIPGSFLRLRLLQSLLTDNNPLHSPPAQLCLKGKVHIFKYLEAAARRPPQPCFPEEFSRPRRRRGLDSGFNSVDSGSKRWSGIEEFPELRRPRRWGGAAADSDPEPLDGSEEDEETPEETPPRVTSGSTSPPRGLSPGGDTRDTTGGREAPPTQRRPKRLWRERGSPQLDPGPTLRTLGPPSPRPRPTSCLFPPSSSKTTAPPSCDPPPDQRQLRQEPLPPPQRPSPTLLVGFALFYGLLLLSAYWALCC